MPHDVAAQDEPTNHRGVDELLLVVCESPAREHRPPPAPLPADVCNPYIPWRPIDRPGRFPHGTKSQTLGAGPSGVLLGGQSSHHRAVQLTAGLGVKHARRRGTAHDCIRLSGVAGADDPLGDVPYPGAELDLRRGGRALSPRSKRARAGCATTASTLEPARPALLQRHEPRSGGWLLLDQDAVVRDRDRGSGDGARR
jgi:hypothetical protein